MPECAFADTCQERRSEQDKFQGLVLEALKNIQDDVRELKSDQRSNDKTFRDLYWKVGLLSGGSGAVAGLITSLAVNAVAR